MTLAEIEHTLRQLRLSGIAATLNTRVLQAQSSQQPLLETLASLLQDEVDRRHSRLSERRFKQSRLDERVTLTDFDWRFNPKLPRQACFELHTLKFIAEGANALIIGKPGTGTEALAPRRRATSLRPLAPLACRDRTCRSLPEPARCQRAIPRKTARRRSTSSISLPSCSPTTLSRA